MLDAFDFLNKMGNPKKRYNLRKCENFSWVGDWAGGNQVFPNSQHDRLVDASRGLFEIIIVLLLAGQKSQKVVLTYLHGRGQFFSMFGGYENPFFCFGKRPGLKISPGDRVKPWQRFGKRKEA